MMMMTCDGYDPKTQTVYQYYGCHCHGCVKCFSTDKQKNLNNGKTRNETFFATAESTRALREEGYRVIEKWECQEEIARDPLPKQETRTYPHAILYDFKSHHNKTQKD